MHFHLRELFSSLMIGICLGVAVNANNLPLGLLALLALLAAVVWVARLNLKQIRSYYYLIMPTILMLGIWLAPRPSSGWLLAAAAAFVMLLVYSLLRALGSRKNEPRSDVPLHHNSFLVGVWLGGFLTVAGLYEAALSHHISLYLIVPLVVVIVFLLVQALAFFFLIPPWEFRLQSLIPALVAGEIMLISSFWMTSAVFVASLTVVALYLFWGLTYHLAKSLLTRHLMYEYGIVSLALTLFILIVNRWGGAS